MGAIILFRLRPCFENESPTHILNLTEEVSDEKR